jgi:hypothetical protein
VVDVEGFVELSGAFRTKEHIFSVDAVIEHLGSQAYCEYCDFFLKVTGRAATELPLIRCLYQRRSGKLAFLLQSPANRVFFLWIPGSPISPKMAILLAKITWRLHSNGASKNNLHSN